MPAYTMQIEIAGTLVGTIWWPIGAECWKPVRHDVTGYDKRCTEPCTLRQHVETLTNDGDFAGGADIADGELIVTVYKPGRTRTRAFPLTMFPSVADMRRDDWEGPTFDGDEE